MNKIGSRFDFQIFRLAPLLLFLASMPQADAAPDIGKPAPDFSAVDSNGKTQALSQYRGKYVVLEWTNNDCPFVRKHYGSGNMQSLQKEETGKGVVWLSVISSGPGLQGNVDAAQANELTRRRDAAPSAVLLDPKGAVGKLYEAKTTPHMFIVDPTGTLIYKGGIDDKASSDPQDIKTATNYVRLALNEAAAGKSVSNPVTRPYGCSVKYAD